MAIKKTNKRSSSKIKKKRNPNWILRFTLVVIAIPVLILAWILLTSIEHTGEPIPGERFDDTLEPAIKQEQLDAIKSSISFPDVQSVEVNLKSATLRINIDVQDAADEAIIRSIIDQSYANVAATLPIETYFTNVEGKKMYDLEINVYNFIPTDVNAGGNIHVIRTKTGASEGPVDDLVSSPKNPETAEEVLN